MYLKRLRDLREDKDLSQNDVAKVLGITQQQYSLYETGIRNLPLEFLCALTKFYETTSDYILGLTNKNINETNKESK